MRGVGRLVSEASNGVCTSSPLHPGTQPGACSRAGTQDTWGKTAPPNCSHPTPLSLISPGPGDTDLRDTWLLPLMKVVIILYTGMVLAIAIFKCTLNPKWEIRAFFSSSREARGSQDPSVLTRQQNEGLKYCRATQAQVQILALPYDGLGEITSRASVCLPVIRR